MKDIEDIFEINKNILYMQVLSNPAMMEQFSNAELSNMIRSVRRYVVNECLYGTNKEALNQLFASIQEECEGHSKTVETIPEREESVNKRVEEFKRTLGSGPKPNLF